MELEPRTTAPAHATGAVEFVSLADVDDDTTFRLREPGDLAPLAASIGRLGHLVPVELRPLPGLGPEDPPRYQVVAGFRRLAALRLLARERVLARVHGNLDDDDAWAIALAQALLGEPLRAPELEALRARLAGTRAGGWADELVDEALVRAPVEPEQREALFALLTGGAPPAAAPAAASGDAEGDTEGDMDELGASSSSASGASSLSPARSGPVASAGASSLSPRSGPAASTGSSSSSLSARSGGRAGEGGPPAAPEPEPAGPVEVTPEELATELAAKLSDVVQDLAVAFEAWADLPEDGRRAILEQARYVAELYPHLKGDGR